MKNDHRQLDDSVREALSAFLDDEADAAALESMLADDLRAGVRMQLQRYQAIRAVFRPQSPALVTVDVLAAVRQQIAIDIKKEADE